MKRIDKVYYTLKEMCKKQYFKYGKINGVSAIDIARSIGIHRANASSDLNKLFREGRIEKVGKKPVLYKINEKDCCEETSNQTQRDVFSKIIGCDMSLKNAVQQAKAALIYPPNGLHTLLVGETGTGKSMFAEVMYEYAKEIGRIDENAPFVEFNCADYAHNPQLLISHLFGVKKGAYTGADKDRTGLVQKANGGILFLDEVHRLPPEGQEMLFYLIDKGLYRSLGESDEMHKVNVLIICATTENVDKSLLKTFTRRIPIVIKLPSLRERSLEERFELIKHFFRVEAATINTNISVAAGSLTALLLYDCPNNIGQLKADIKLCCAKAYLRYMVNRDEKVCVNIGDLPDYVRKGLLKYKKYKDKIDKYVNKDIITFFASEAEAGIELDKKSFCLYEMLEEKRKELENRGLGEKDIQLVMSLEIENYLKRYMAKIENGSLSELYKVVDKKIVNIVDEFLKEAEVRLNKHFSEKVLYGLSIHVASSIERLMNGKKIENHNLPKIKKVYSKEYEVARDIKSKIESHFNVNVPDDEIGFVTMFLTMYNDEKDDDRKVGVIVAMHGDSAATSIADVVNRLLGVNHAIGYNMPLSEKPEETLNNLIDIVKRVNKGKGVILLVDMGSLIWFGDMIYERTGIPVKTVDMVSTPMVLEATRKALLNSSLDEVYDAVVNLSPFTGRIFKESIEFDGGLTKNVIITACLTGKGTALKLKSILEKRLKLKERRIDVIPIEVENKEDFKHKIQTIKAEKNILAVVSTINPEDSSVLYLSTLDLLKGNGISLLADRVSLIDGFEIIDNMEEVIKENISIDARKFITSFKTFYNQLVNTGTRLDVEKLSGLILHLACVLERVLRGDKLTHIKNVEKRIRENIDKVNTIKHAIKSIEESFEISISDEECFNIAKIVYSI